MTNAKMTKKTQETLCGGGLELIVNKATGTITGKFTNVKVCNSCTVCPFQEVCSLRFEVKAPPAKKAATPPVRVIPEDAQTVMVYAFTGMPIGNLLVLADGKDLLEVETKGGQKLVFDKATGLQTNCKNPKYANRLHAVVKEPKAE